MRLKAKRDTTIFDTSVDRPLEFDEGETIEIPMDDFEVVDGELQHEIDSSKCWCRKGLKPDTPKPEEQMEALIEADKSGEFDKWKNTPKPSMKVNVYHEEYWRKLVRKCQKYSHIQQVAYSTYHD